MEIDFLVRVSAHMDFFLPRQNLSSFVADCYFPTTKHPKVTRLAFDRAQVLEWVLHTATIVIVNWFSFSISGQF